MDKFLALCAPLALLIWVVYALINRFIVKIPDAIAWPILIICILLMAAGIAYNGWCWRNGINAFDCLKK